MLLQILLLVVAVLMTGFYWYIRDQLAMCARLLSVAGATGPAGKRAGRACMQQQRACLGPPRSISDADAMLEHGMPLLLFGASREACACMHVRPHVSTHRMRERTCSRSQRNATAANNVGVC